MAYPNRHDPMHGWEGSTPKTNSVSLPKRPLLDKFIWEENLHFCLTKKWASPLSRKENINKIKVRQIILVYLGLCVPIGVVPYKENTDYNRVCSGPLSLALPKKEKNKLPKQYRTFIYIYIYIYKSTLVKWYLICSWVLNALYWGNSDNYIVDKIVQQQIFLDFAPPWFLWVRFFSW